MMMVESPSVPVLSRVEIFPNDRCPDCESFLNIHQPDAELPDRLIATCGACGTWFLIYSDSGIRLRLPKEDEVRHS
jgi:hypothetical protein